MRNASTQMVYNLAKRDRDVMALTADNSNEIYDKIKREMPGQYIDYGIAEENMVASAAGLASCGKIPFLYTITNFMSMHAFEFIRNDVCVANQNVKFLGRSSGLVSSSMGATHQGTEEVALLRTLPNMLVITPATPIEAREATRFAYHHRGSVYIRLEGFNEPELYGEDYQFSVGRGYVLRDGGDITVISMGSVVNEALSAAKKLESDGIRVRVINMPMVNPIDRDLIVAAAKETGHIITLEEHSIHGGLGSAVAEVLAESGTAASFHRMGLNGCAKGCGNREAMREINGLASGSIMEKVRESLQR
ncbi:Transketolase, C-terminal domain protein [Selenomonas flueggei ATCC 43531]|uniref:Transketolase, C-terminal domain protein n=1 Tax=Selenomonas flueggei ATCC 43531 TaxID=638302 RepID=C4V639_9FIRM|nr:Transketolase, C-terminal domain protein [Selenomonas flueggei ATCC 43531]